MCGTLKNTLISTFTCWWPFVFYYFHSQRPISAVQHSSHLLRIFQYRLKITKWFFLWMKVKFFHPILLRTRNVLIMSLKPTIESSWPHQLKNYSPCSIDHCMMRVHCQCTRVKQCRHTRIKYKEPSPLLHMSKPARCYSTWNENYAHFQLNFDLSKVCLSGNHTYKLFDYNKSNRNSEYFWEFPQTKETA